MSEVDFEHLVSLSQELHCVLDVDCRCVYLGTELERFVLGLSRSSHDVYFADFLHPNDSKATIVQLRELAKGTRQIVFTNRIRSQDGKYQAVFWTAAWRANTRLIYLVGSRMNSPRRITEETQEVMLRDQELQQQLDQAQNRLTELLRVEGLGSWEHDHQNDVVWWSNEVYLILELERSPDPPTYDDFLLAIHPDDRDLVNRAHQKSLADHHFYEVEYRLLMPDGRIKYVHEQGHTSYDRGGQPVSTMGTIREITQRKVWETRLLESNARFAAALEGVATGFFILDRQWHYQFINTVGAQLVSRTREDLQGKVIWEEFPQAVGSGFYQVYHRVMDSRQPEILEEYFELLDMWFEVHVYPYVDGISVFFLDTTQRKRDERELLKKEAAIAASPVGILIAETSGEIVYANPAVLRLWTYTEEDQVLGQSVETLWKDKPLAEEAISTLRNGSKWSGELLVPGRDGSANSILVAGNAILDARAEAVGVVMSFVDITEHREFEAALSLTSLAIETSLNGIVITDEDGRAVYANSSYQTLFGYSPEDIGTEKPLENFSESPSVGELSGQLSEHGSWQGELLARRKDGRTFEAIVSASVIREADESVSHIVLSIMDISDKKRLEEQFLQAQKMESVGRLAGGVAHDFNNLLTVIMGNVEMAQAKLAADDASQMYLSQIDKAAHSAASVTQQLLAFSRRQIIAPRAVNLNTIVGRIRSMLQRLIGEDVMLETHLSESLSNVVFDPGQMEQILINLTINAHDSMPNGGRITLTTGEVAISEVYSAENPGVEPGEYVTIAVSDNGHGMTSEVQEHLFEPFFTTKGREKGTGLGLAMVHGAVSQNGGRIEVRSEIGKGATFTIYLPSIDEEVCDIQTATTQEIMPRGDERILVVEDDEGIRVIAENLLEALGYTVTLCKDGDEALRRTHSGAEPFDLLITDVILPGMDGKRVADRVREKLPAIRVLFTSGYTEDVIVHHGILETGVRFLPKPYSPAALALRVREALDDPSL